VFDVVLISAGVFKTRSDAIFKGSVEGLSNGTKNTSLGKIG
jgi:hypothetical protein